MNTDEKNALLLHAMFESSKVLADGFKEIAEAWVLPRRSTPVYGANGELIGVDVAPTGEQSRRDIR